MSDYQTYAIFNTLIICGIWSHPEVVKGNNGDDLAGRNIAKLPDE